MKISYSPNVRCGETVIPRKRKLYKSANRYYTYQKNENREEEEKQDDGGDDKEDDTPSTIVQGFSKCFNNDFK